MNPRHDHQRSEMRETHLRLAEPGVVGGNREIAHHASARNRRPAHAPGPRRSQAWSSTTAPCRNRMSDAGSGPRCRDWSASMSLARSGDMPMSNPALKLRPSARSTMTDVAGSLSARAKRLDDLVLHRRVDGVELVGPVKRDDPDLVVGLVTHQFFCAGLRHSNLQPPSAGARASKRVPGRHERRTRNHTPQHGFRVRPQAAPE